MTCKITLKSKNYDLTIFLYLNRLFSFTESVDADCSHSFEGPFTRDLKIQTNFASHPMIKSPDGVKSLVIYFGASSYIFNGLGKAFKNLELLYIPDNSLRILERSNFFNMTKLRRLELYDKQIEFIAEDSFSDLPNLEILSMFKCGVDEFPDKLLHNLKKLKKFEAVFNRITFLHADFFSNNLEIEEIAFRNNQLKVIEVDFLKFPKLKSLRLDYNDCIDASFIVTNTATISLKELQSIINDKCKKNNESKFNESWWKIDK
jgi:Leucine-rich repeat (LRR) protein